MGNNSSKLSQTKDKGKGIDRKDSKVDLNLADTPYTAKFPNLGDHLSPFEWPEHPTADSDTSGVNDYTEAGYGYIAPTSSKPAASLTSITATVGAADEIVSHVSSDNTVSPSSPDLVSLASSASKLEPVQGSAQPSFQSFQQRGTLPFSSPSTEVGRAALLSELARVKKEQNTPVPARNHTSIWLGHPVGPRASENATFRSQIRTRLRDRCRNKWEQIKAKRVCCTRRCLLAEITTDLNTAASIVERPAQSQSIMSMIQRGGESQEGPIMIFGLQDRTFTNSKMYRPSPALLAQYSDIHYGGSTTDWQKLLHSFMQSQAVLVADAGITQHRTFTMHCAKYVLCGRRLVFATDLANYMPKDVNVQHSFSNLGHSWLFAGSQRDVDVQAADHVADANADFSTA